VSTNYTPSSQTPGGATESGDSLFAATPIWERGGKKRRGGLGRSAAPSATTGAATGATTATGATASTLGADTGHSTVSSGGSTMGGSTVGGASIDRPIHSHSATTTAASEPMMAAPPRTHTTAPKKKAGIPAGALAAGVVALGGLAAAGWYASQPNDGGLAQLEPGQPSEMAAATSSAAPMASTAPTQTAGMDTAAPPAVTAGSGAGERATISERRSGAPRDVAISRTRPAATAAAAGEVGVNASATTTLPAGPQPYSALSGGAPSSVTTDTPTAAPSPTAPATVPTLPADPATGADAGSTTAADPVAPEATTQP
jgi:hypothetical protein